MQHTLKKRTQKSTSAALAKNVLAATARLRPRWLTLRNRALKSRQRQSAFPALSFHGNGKKHADHVTPAMAVAATAASTTVQKLVAFASSKRKKYTCPECRYSWTPNTSGCCDAGCDAACDDGCAKTDISKTLPTKVVSHGVSMPPWLRTNATQTEPRELHTTELQPVQIQARTPWSSYNRQ